MLEQNVNYTQKLIDDLKRNSISLFEVDFSQPEVTENDISDWMIKSGRPPDSG